MAKTVAQITSAEAHEPQTLAKQPGASNIAAVQLLMSLQASLDIEQVIKTLYAELQRGISLSGLRFATGGSDELEVRCGRRARCRWVYSLTISGQKLGELTLYRTKSTSDAEERLMESLVGLITLPVRNALKYRAALRAARHCPLTGLMNRAAMEEQVSREIELSSRHRQPMALIVLDVDQFKAINDTHGHQVGDEVLKSVAEALRECARQSDLVFRYAGDEFVIALSHTDLAGAEAVAERILKHTTDTVIHDQDAEVRYGVSIGIASMSAGDTWASLFDRADRALYGAKRAGRGCSRVQ